MDRSRSVFDDNASFLAVGAAVENLHLAASACGLACEVDGPSAGVTGDRVARVRFVADPRVTRDPLAAEMAARATNRRDGLVAAPSAVEVAALVEEARSRGAHLAIETSKAAVADIAHVVAVGDRIRYLCRSLQQGLVREIRWTPEEAEATRDGVDIETLELDAADKAGLRVISRWEVMKLVGGLGGGLALEKASRKAIIASGTVGLLGFAGASPLSFAAAGRAMQRVWLRATAQGYYLHPLTAITYLLERVARGDRAGLDDAQVDELAGLHQILRRVFPMPDGHRAALLFRLVRAGPPSAVSLRRDVDAVLSLV
jgi:hypothetical protein